MVKASTAALAITALILMPDRAGGLAEPSRAGDIRVATQRAPAAGEPVEQRVHVIPAPSEPESPPGLAPQARPARAEGITTVTVLFAYTKIARKSSRNIDKKARALVSWINRAFKNSGVKARLEMVTPVLLKGYDESSKTFGETLDDLRFGPRLEKVRRARDRRRADLVMLIRSNIGDGPGLTCSSTYITEQPSNRTADQGVAVLSRIPNRSCPIRIFAATVGTMTGLQADRFVVPKASKRKFNFGYVNLRARIRTIMASNAKCGAKGTSCESIQAFSTPRRTYQGHRIGIPKGEPGAADNARQLNINRAAIAAYR